MATMRIVFGFTWSGAFVASDSGGTRLAAAKNDGTPPGAIAESPTTEATAAAPYSGLNHCTGSVVSTATPTGNGPRRRSLRVPRVGSSGFGASKRGTGRSSVGYGLSSFHEALIVSRNDAAVSGDLLSGRK